MPYCQRKPFKIPGVLSQGEARQLLDSIQNLKHRCILATMYSAGLRVGELIELKVKDIDSARMIIAVRGGKGNKDRYLPLS